jgi:hypothetical protein
LGLTNTKVLIPKQNFIQKLVTYTTPDNSEKVRNAMFEAAQELLVIMIIAVLTLKVFTFKGNEDSNPVIGEKGKLHTGTK